jgi:hypothetical protein
MAVESTHIELYLLPVTFKPGDPGQVTAKMLGHIDMHSSTTYDEFLAELYVIVKKFPKVYNVLFEFKGSDNFIGVSVDNILQFAVEHLHKTVHLTINEFTQPFWPNLGRIAFRQSN